METIVLSEAITNYINDAQYEFEQGNIEEGKHFLNVVKHLVVCSSDIRMNVTFEYLNKVSLFVSNCK